MLQIINTLFTAVYILLFAYVIISWVRPDPYSQFGQIARVIYNLIEPILAPIRQILPPMGGLDLSPIILFLIIRLVQQLLYGILLS